MGFAVVRAKKGAFVDSHECQDVVEYHKKILRRMVALGFLNLSNAPTDQAKLALPHNFECPSEEVLSKTVIFFMMKALFNLMKINPICGQ